MDVRAVDAAGVVANTYLTVTVNPTDLTADDTFIVNYPTSQTNFPVPQSSPPTTLIGTVAIASENTSAAASQAGYNSLQFHVTGETYYKNGVQVADFGVPITVVQNPNDRSVLPTSSQTSPITS